MVVSFDSFKLIHKTEKALKNKDYYSAFVFDINQAFGKVWHPRSFYRFKKDVSRIFTLKWLTISNQTERRKLNKLPSDLLHVLSPYELLIICCTITGTFVDNTVIIAIPTMP